MHSTRLLCGGEAQEGGSEEVSDDGRGADGPCVIMYGFAIAGVVG